MVYFIFTTQLSSIVIVNRLIDFYYFQKGLCPQHDVLYDRLTVKEHLWFFGKLKGLSSDEIDSEVEKMMESIKLADKANAQTRYLSGGMKRKLSLGVALIGKTKVDIITSTSRAVVLFLESTSEDHS